jgi:hypothetical protein
MNRTALIEYCPAEPMCHGQTEIIRSTATGSTTAACLVCGSDAMPYLDAAEIDAAFDAHVHVDVCEVCDGEFPAGSVTHDPRTKAFACSDCAGKVETCDPCGVAWYAIDGHSECTCPPAPARPFVLLDPHAELVEVITHAGRGAYTVSTHATDDGHSLGDRQLGDRHRVLRHVQLRREAGWCRVTAAAAVW